MKAATIEAKGGVLVLRTPYDPTLVADLKAQVPTADRKWNPTQKVWEIDPAHGQTLQVLCLKHGYPAPALPAGVLNTAPAQTMRILEVRYLGRVKQRQAGDESAFAWVDGGWNAVFPKSALFAWFGKDERPGEAATLYQVLGVKPDAQLGDIKTAWKRMARMWHPDHCREPDAAAQFRAIKDAYDVLADNGKRARYDAGLALEAAWKATASPSAVGMVTVSMEWAPPLRCGLIMAEGVDKLGRFIVSEIMTWQDITDGAGRVLVTSWPMGTEHFIESWVEA